MSKKRLSKVIRIEKSQLAVDNVFIRLETKRTTYLSLVFIHSGSNVDLNWVFLSVSIKIIDWLLLPF